MNVQIDNKVNDILNPNQCEDKLSSKPPSDGSNPQIDSDIMNEKQLTIQKAKRDKKKKREEKKKIVTAAKAILFTELLGSCLVILYMFLFYAKIYISKQEGSISYIVLFIFSDALFISSWVASFAALVLRNDRCINYCNYSLSFNVILKVIALIVYYFASNNDQTIPLSKLIIGLTIGMIVFSFVFIFLYSYMKKRWAFIPADRWQRKFNPNLRYEDIKKSNNNAIQQSISSQNTNAQNMNNN